MDQDEEVMVVQHLRDQLTAAWDLNDRLIKRIKKLKKDLADARGGETGPRATTPPKPHRFDREDLYVMNRAMDKPDGEKTFRQKERQQKHLKDVSYALDPSSFVSIADDTERESDPNSLEDSQWTHPSESIATASLRRNEFEPRTPARESLFSPAADPTPARESTPPHSAPPEGVSEELSEGLPEGLPEGTSGGQFEALSEGRFEGQSVHSERPPGHLSHGLSVDLPDQPAHLNEGTDQLQNILPEELTRPLCPLRSLGTSDGRIISPEIRTEPIGRSEPIEKDDSLEFNLERRSKFSKARQRPPSSRPISAYVEMRLPQERKKRDRVELDSDESMYSDSVILNPRKKNFQV